MKMIRIGVIENYLAIRNELVKMLHASDKFKYVLSSKLTENFNKYLPNELDINLSRISEIQPIPQLEAKFPITEFLILSKHEDPDWISETQGVSALS